MAGNLNSSYPTNISVPAHKNKWFCKKASNAFRHGLSDWFLKKLYTALGIVPAFSLFGNAAARLPADAFHNGYKPLVTAYIV